jgi:HlyD family secretion protein
MVMSTTPSSPQNQTHWPPQAVPDSNNATPSDSPLTLAALSSPLEPTQFDEDWSSATQESLNTLPQVWTRGILYVILAVAAILLPWVTLAKVDEIGSARGRLEPQGKTIRLDAPVSGTIAKVQIQEGDSVKVGQSLLELDSGVINAELQQAQVRLEGLTERLTQLELVRNQIEMTVRAQRLQNQAQAAAQMAQIAQTRQQLEFRQTTLTTAEALLSKDLDRVNRYRALQEQGIVSGTQVEDAERTMLENSQRLEQSRSELQQGQTEIDKQQHTYERMFQEGEMAVMAGDRQQKELNAQIVEVKTEINQIEKQIKILKYQWQQRVIYAPVDGTVFQLQMQHAGAVVQPGQPIVQIAPQEAKLILKAQMDTQNSGFLRVGLPVKIKFDAYPFQDYGIVEGRVIYVSPDSKTVQSPQGSREVFELDIELNQSYIQTSNKRINLTPGQTATAEVIIRQRRVVDFFLDPFRKLQQDSLMF